MNWKANILVVDDTPANLQLLVAMLSEQGYKVRPANNGRIALRAAHLAPPDLVLLDVNMPDMDGYEVCRQLKATEVMQDVPVIFISALNEINNIVHAFSVGGVDYITKPFKFEEVKARVDTHLQLYWQKQQIAHMLEQERAYFEKITAMKDEVVQTASHDMRGPLTLVTMGVELLQERIETDSTAVQQSISLIQRGADRMLHLITDVLDLATLETGLALKKEMVLLSQFLEVCLAEREPMAHLKNVSLQFSPQTEDITLALDVNQMQRAIDNLLSNSIKYTPEGGMVRIEMETAVDGVIIHISDTGHGIPAEDIPHLFNRFYRVQTPQHLAADGTGLGLSIVQSIVEQHEGHIKVESTLGQGSTFSLSLPISV